MVLEEPHCYPEAENLPELPRVFVEVEVNLFGDRFQLESALASWAAGA